MDSFFRALIVYGVLLIFFRLSGKRSLAQITVFDFVMLLIIAEGTQQALLGDDFSITNGVMVVLTLLTLDVLLSWIALRVRWVEKLVDGTPTVILERGNMIEDRTRKARVDKGDILEAARRLQGLERLEQIKYAILEVDGSISIIPEPQAARTH